MFGPSDVRNLRLAVVVSTVVHAAGVAWLATRPRAPRAAEASPASAPIEIVTVDRPPASPPAAPLEVVLLDQPASAVPPPSDPARAPAPAPSASPIPSPRAAAPASHAVTSLPPGSGAAGRAGEANETGRRGEAGPTGEAGQTGEPATRSPGRTSLLAMRHGEAPSAALPLGRWDDLDHAPRGTAPTRDPTTGILHESGGGTHRSDQGVFTARVDPDGSARLTDRRNLHVHLALPTPRALGHSFARWYESDKGRFGAEGDTSMARQIQASGGAPTDPKDDAKGQAGDRETTVIVPVLAGGFDVTDWLMRSHGQDPYAHKKLAFLDATRDERVELGSRHRAAELARAPELVRRNLEALWARTRDRAARKQGLFELWDDCAETGDPAVVAAGDAARRLIIGFLRSHLPAGSAGAFTPAEIAALARTKRSKAAFQPYE